MILTGNLWQKHFTTSAATQNWMSAVIILKRDFAIVKWMCAAMHEWTHQTFTSVW